MGLVIREQVEADIEEVALLGVLAAARRDGRPAPDAVPPRLLAASHKVSARPGSWGLVGVAGERLVAEMSGFAVDAAEQPTPRSQRHYICSLSVAPDVWGHGYGRTMLDAGLDFLRTQGVVEAEAWVVRGNDRARSVYRLCGFVETGRSTDYGDVIADEMLCRIGG